MSDFFDSEFKFERYIETQLLEVKDEEQRRALKEVLRASLIPFYQNTEEAYHELYNKLVATKEKQNGRYQILTGLADRKRVDVTEEALVPMQPKDVEEQLVDMDELAEAMEEHRAYSIMRVYLNVDYESIHKLALSRREWKGRLYTEEDDYEARFQLRQNNSYMRQLVELYPVFAENNVPWRCYCAPYLMKFFDVELIGTDCPREEQITSITVDFEEWKDCVSYDLIPMWNVRRVGARSSAFPDFAVDKIHYEHLVFKEKLNQERDYLVCQEDQKLWEVFRQDGDIHIVCDVDVPTKFDLLEFGYEALERSYDYPVFYNENLNQAKERCLHTMSDVKRFIKGLHYEEWLRLVDVRFETAPYQGCKLTYSVNSFLEDELRTAKNRDLLVCVFEAKKPGNTLLADVMSYLVSCLQWQFPEFECIGEY